MLGKDHSRSSKYRRNYRPAARDCYFIPLLELIRCQKLPPKPVCRAPPLSLYPSYHWMAPPFRFTWYSHQNVHRVQIAARSVKGAMHAEKKEDCSLERKAKEVA